MLEGKKQHKNEQDNEGKVIEIRIRMLLIGF